MPPPAADYYALLGVPATADAEELRRAWRRLALRLHPDRAGDGATATFQQLAAAYAVLSDPIARAAYDRRRRAAEPTGAVAPRAPAATSPPPRAARPPAPAIMLSRLSGPLSSLIACGAARLDEPGFITLALRDAEAAQGGMATISLRVELWCPDCAVQQRSTACARCGGTRTVDELFSAWLAVPPGVTSGEVLAPSVELPGMVEPVRFRVRLPGS
ncbi:MAG: DnaJ domain-containing protein [Byssovorax sp.]